MSSSNLPYSLPTTASTPSTTSYIIATAILAGVIGYFVGQGASLGLFGGSSSSRRNGVQKGKEASESDSESETDEDEDEDKENEGGELATFEGNSEEVKLVLVV